MRRIMRVIPMSLEILAHHALTVRTQPGDDVATYKEIPIAQLCDVRFVDGAGAMDHSLLGEMSTASQSPRG